MRSESRLGLAVPGLLFTALAVAQAPPMGPEFQVNTYTVAWQFWPVVASDSAGNFVVVWNSNGQDGSGNGIFGRRYDSSGAPQGGDRSPNSRPGLSPFPRELAERDAIPATVGGRH